MLSITHDILVYLVNFSSCSQILHWCYHFSDHFLNFVFTPMLTEKKKFYIYFKNNYRSPSSHLPVVLHGCILSCFTCVRPFATLWTVTSLAPLSIWLSRQEYCSGFPCPPPRDLLDLGVKPASLVLAGMFLITSATWEAYQCCYIWLSSLSPTWKIGYFQFLTNIFIRCLLFSDYII